MDAATRDIIWARARNRCEHCRLHQDDYDFQTFHVEHIIARQHGGSNDPSNLCLACSECNWSKGPNVAGLIDGRVIALFHPRKQSWKRHFEWDGTTLLGKTKVGIATIRVLNMNSES